MASSIVSEKSVVCETPGNPDVCAPVQLYVKFIEADSLERVNSKNPDLFVEFWIEDLAGKELSGSRSKTRLYKSSVQPKWNEEWVLPRLSTDQSKYRIRFVLYKHHSLWPNADIGQGSVNLDSLVDNEMKDVSLDLVRSDPLEIDGKQQELKSLPHEPSCGKLKLLLQKTSLSETLEDKLKRQTEISKKWIRLSGLRIVLEKLAYYPGEIVRGMVVINIGNAQRIRALRLHVVGETLVHWSEGFSPYDQFDYGAAESYINSTKTLVGNGVKYADGEEMEFKGQSFCFPFSFPLAVTLPPTYYGIRGSTSYRVTTYADFRLKFNKKDTVAFQVLAQYHSSIPSAISITGGGDIPFTISAQTTADAGSIIPISLVIENPPNSGKSILEIRVSLVQQSSFKGRQYVWQGRDSLNVIVSSSMTAKSSSQSSNIATEEEIQVLPIAPGQRRELTFPIEIPVLTPPTCPEQLCPILNNQYYIEGCITTDGNLFTTGKNTKQIPIVISRRFVLPPRPIDAPKHIESQLPVRMWGDGSVSIDGTVRSGIFRSVTVVSTIDSVVSQKHPLPQSSAPNPQDQTPEVQPQHDEGSSPIPKESAPESPAYSSVSRTAPIGFDVATVLETQPTNPSRGPTTYPYLIESSQHVKSSELSLTSLNGLLDGPVTFIVDPRRVVLQTYHNGLVDDPRAHRSPIPHHIVVPTDDKNASPPVPSGQESSPIDKSNVPPSYDEAISASTPQSGATTDDAPTKSPINVVGKYSDPGSTISVWSPSPAFPTFDAFLPPRPLDSWSMIIPVSAAKLPDYTKLKLRN